jgi:hypothetical protein
LEQLTAQPSAKWTIALNNLIRQNILDSSNLSGYSNWSQLDRLWIFAADNQQNAGVSIVNPASTQITETGSPTWTKDVGYTGNGSSIYLNTNYNPTSNGVNFVLNNACMGIYTSGADTLNNFNIGAWSNSSYDGLSYLNINGTNGQYGLNLNSGGNGDAHSVGASTGLQVVTNAASSTNAQYLNGSLVSTNTSYPTILLNANLFVFCANEYGTPVDYSNATVGMVFTGSASINQLKLYNAWNTFLTAI